MELPKALFFDVFGTCVDWRTTVTDTLDNSARAALSSQHKQLDPALRERVSSWSKDNWASFAQEWRNSYKKFVYSLATDPTLPWKTVDEHHLEALNHLLAAHKLEGLWNSDELRDLNLVWHRLAPWSDTAAGLKALNSLTQTATLSNGNIDLLNDLNTNGHLEFQHVLSGEMFGSYKPSPKVYLGAAARLELEPRECAMVAAHLGDLRAAKSCGLRTVYVERPMEEDWAEDDVERAKADGWVDLWVGEEEGGFVGLAERLARLRG
ncbi:haloacid dehalogenase [Sporormia fimetaria CBS 119925]|uniref:Haloacid dehalogenase n=1 Tax=Sporormia fimetaria CBS 119925 TaxID=1340428 RepID=A0A6A6UWT1_9PLEO|nr:haloacid dehalogenase [Sporormia fimetaria CBS 119925]